MGWVIPLSWDVEGWLPWSLRSVAGAPYYGAEEKTGHSGRDDGVRKEKRVSGI
jgi:hypothetical protein